MKHQVIVLLWKAALCVLSVSETLNQRRRFWNELREEKINGKHQLCNKTKNLFDIKYIRSHPKFQHQSHNVNYKTSFFPNEVFLSSAAEIFIIWKWGCEDLPCLKFTNANLEQCELGRQSGSFCLKSLNFALKFLYIASLPLLRASSRLSICQYPLFITKMLEKLKYDEST